MIKAFLSQYFRLKFQLQLRFKFVKIVTHVRLHNHVAKTTESSLAARWVNMAPKGSLVHLHSCKSTSHMHTLPPGPAACWAEGSFTVHRDRLGLRCCAAPPETELSTELAVLTRAILALN